MGKIEGVTRRAEEVGDGNAETRPPAEARHIVQFYEDDAFLCDIVARFVGAGIVAGESVVVIATELHRHAFCQRLKSDHVDVAAAKESGRLMMLDARETLERFMVDGQPDWDRFVEVVGGVLKTAAAHRGRVRAYGEMIDLLWRTGNPAGAVRLERMWNELGGRHDFSLLCAYVMHNFYKEEDAKGTEEICRAHSQVVTSDGSLALDERDAREREIDVLQQRARALQIEVERRREAEAKLAELLAERTREGAQTEERFKRLVASVTDYAIFMLDATGHVISWNAGAQRIKGWDAEEIIGQHFSRFYEEAEVRSGKCEMELEVAARDGRFEDEGWRVRKDGTRFWANVIISRMRDAKGELIGFAKVTRDLTERRKLEEERRARAALEAELAEQKKTSEMREQLIAIVGHDLRSPLAAMSTAVSAMIKRAVVPDAELKSLALIARNAERMTRMVSQLLDFTRARLGGGVPVERQDVDLGRVCVDLIAELEARRPDREIVFDCDVDTRGFWDPDRIGQVAANLLGNAVQHGTAGAAIHVHALDAGDEVRLVVQNAGVIPADVLPHVFSPFRRGRNDTTSKSESLGLGLYIVEEIVRAHGGTIEARSSEAEGTTFEVRLPRRA